MASPAESVAENFFRQVVLPNGTFKTTDRRRLNDLNDFCLPFLQALPARPLRIMDAAASSGCTTAEWRTQLQQAGLSVEITATDKLPSATLVSLIPGVSALIDEGHHVLHFDVLGLGLSPRVSKTWLAPLKIALQAIFKAAYAPGKPTVPVPLAYPGSGVPVEYDDLLARTPPPWQAAFDVVRAANVLNRACFSDHDLARILENLQERLRPGGLLIVSRTREEDGKNLATIFRLENRKAVPLARLNGGADVPGW